MSHRLHASYIKNITSLNYSLEEKRFSDWDSKDRGLIIIIQHYSPHYHGRYKSPVLGSFDKDASETLSSSLSDCRLWLIVIKLKVGDRITD